MQIRKANKNDNAYTILELIYNTDAYIYPVLMGGDYKNYAYLLQDYGMYNYENIIVATVDGEIAGLLISFTNDVHIHSMPNQELETYYTHLKESLDNQSLYINNVSVGKKFRGRGIATKLIQYIAEHTTKPKLVLDCLAENEKTICLYEKLGFTVIESTPAFCIDKTKTIMDVRMERELRTISNT